MKSLAELRALREKMLSQTDNRSVAGEGETVIKVGMATCGIAAGARPVLDALLDEAEKRHLPDGLHRHVPLRAHRRGVQGRAEIYIRTHDGR